MGCREIHFRSRCFLAPLLIVPVLLIASCLSSEPNNEFDTENLGYNKEHSVEFLNTDLDRARYGNLRSSIPVIGSVISSNQVDISTQQAGNVSKTMFKRGDFVHRGDLLASLDKEIFIHRREQAKSQYDVGSSQLVLAQKDFSNTQQLYKKGFVSDFAFETASANLQQKKAQLALYKAQYEEICDQIRDADFYSPINGYVADSYVNTGQSVVPGQKLFSVLDLEHLEASLMVPAENILRIKIKTPAELFIGNAHKHINSFVSRISPKSEPDSHTFTVFAPVPNPGNVFKEGVFVKGFLVTDVHRHAIVVPEVAIHEESGRSFVYLISNDKIVKQYVETGLIDKVQSYVEILSGLKNGDLIVSKDLGSLAQGTYVKIVTLAGGKA
ncbi:MULTISPECIES: efflux RND transporter periplasmic adaptor subunit [Candidatus Ichthyocystis]|uniref:efflux RND transporter periplasmic adaptor subunit n=1 Tax=Candidatus Ichthyocystis TaxID=2929841 RepID=UPI000B86B49D|nr:MULTISPECIES: efflux RND transporter periplasmic adaptor subunit [Ichthyocystis]